MRRENIAILVVCAVEVLAILACLFITQGDKQDKNDHAEKPELVPVTVGAYNLSYLPYDPSDPRYYDDSYPISDYKNGDHQFMTVKGEGEVLYTTFDEFVSLYKNDYADGYSGSVTSAGNAATWTIKDKDGKEIYHLTVDADRQEFRSHGDTFQAIKRHDGKNTLMDGLSFQVTEIKNAGKESVYSFKGYGLDPIMHEGKAYLPIGLLSMHTQHDIERAFLYSSKDSMLLEYADAEQKKSSFSYEPYGEFASIDKIMSGSMAQYERGEGEKSTIVPPAYMLEHTKKLFTWIIDNYYGLREVLGYKDMSDYVDNTVYKDSLLSEDDRTRSSAYSVLVSLLNDGHTSFGNSFYLREGSVLAPTSYPQTLLNDRSALNRLLNPIREAEIAKAGETMEKEDVRYSSDGKTAYFSFDEFMIAHYYKETPTESDFYRDTYHAFLKNLKDIKNKGGVERVVIDDSLNGGGYVLVLGKLLALMSKDNNASLYLKNDNSGTVTKYSFRVDSNGDGAYDTEDCFGQHFRFYMITSPYSFSCGNAMPFYAQKNGFALIAGTKSGGGECTVDTVVFPFGQTMHYSSSNHIGLYNEATGEFIGAEVRANPNVATQFNIYDVDKASEVLIDYEVKNKL